YGEWLHGEAVAAGMVMAAELSGLDQAAIDRVTELIAAAGLPTAPPAIEAKKLRAAMETDKKVRRKHLRFVLLDSIGEAYLGTEYSESMLDTILDKAGNGHP
ncbi:MAG: 3-dehydroquinate synthase, partial [Woeseia sp.]